MTFWGLRQATGVIVVPGSGFGQRLSIKTFGPGHVFEERVPGPKSTKGAILVGGSTGSCGDKGFISKFSHVGGTLGPFQREHIT